MMQHLLIIKGAVQLATFLKEAFKLSLSELSVTSRFTDGLAGGPAQELRVHWSTSGTRDNIERKTEYRYNKWPELTGKGADAALTKLVDELLKPHEEAVIAALPLVTSVLHAWSVRCLEERQAAPIAKIPLDLVAEGLFKEMTQMPAFREQIFAELRKADYS